jgi:hypothetical protein
MPEKERIKAQNLAFHGIIVTFIIWVTAIVGAVYFA